MDGIQQTVYRGSSPVVDTTYEDSNDDAPSMVVIDAVATAASVEPTGLPPLYEFVDPDAIDTLVARHTGTETAQTLLMFTIDTWEVFVNADGRIRVCDATRPTDPTPVFNGTTA